MVVNPTYFDHAIGESQGNGGDLQLLGNDLALVYGNENQVYLALFGGNVEQNTPALITNAQTEDYWGNNLFWPNDPSKQFNSNTERTLNTTALNSAGRITIENAVKSDLKFLVDMGATVTVNVTIPSVNLVTIMIRTVYKDGIRRMTIIKFGKQFTDGDFSLVDFNEDFF